MKKMFILGICALSNMMVKAQNVMVIENNDHTTTKVIIEKVKRIFFEEVTFNLDKDSLSLLEGSQYKLNLTNNTGQSVEWSSSNTSVATVDNLGTVNALTRIAVA